MIKLFGKTGTENGQSKRYLTPFLVPFLLVLSVFAYGCDDNKSETVAETERKYFYVPDANFARILKYKDAVWITTIDGVNRLNIDAVSKFEGSLDIASSNIKSLEGIEYFTSLTGLNCDNNQLKTLDVSKNVNLTWLRCDNNQLKTLDVSKNVNLTWLRCDNNQLKTLDVSKNVNLTWLRCDNNQLKTLDVSGAVNLEALDCEDNQLKTLDVSKNVNLTRLDCEYNQLQTLDVSKNVNLTGLDCYNNLLKTLDVSQNVKLWWLSCSDNQLQTLDVSGAVNLTWLSCFDNQLQTLDVSGAVNLKTLNVGCERGCEFEDVDVGCGQECEFDVVELLFKLLEEFGYAGYAIRNNGGNSNSGLTSVKVHSSVATHQELKNAKNATGLQIDTYTAASGSTTYTQAICDFDPSTGLRASTARACTP
ncbi:hypothetical protein CHS0354_000819 [Potamilus streckersoni]|uniref:Uncharacterized protein n=1 Tax=Potamilus streckersoni TaxID=2493646 RepID=A0AAE0T795_9BIVA|nr:hypothetical protein CHS0354_000819 [Potamilus streckersoni]